MDKFMENLKKGFSVFVSEAGKITKTVAGKTNNFVDVTKLNLTLNDIDRKITAIYEKIGETVYEKYIAGDIADDSFSDLFKEIEAFKAEQESLKAQIAELKNAITCSECGQNNSKDSEFCSKCGTKLSPESEAPEEDKVIEVVDFDEE